MLGQLSPVGIQARELYLRAEEKVRRLKAEKAFLDAGGARGEFALRWTSAFVEIMRSQRTTDAASGN